MLWYNNPDGVAALHRQALEDRYADRRRRTLLQLAKESGPDERH
jgi:hypothetical protein